MRRRNIDTVCLQETRGGKAQKLGKGCKLLYSGGDGTRNGVGIVMGRDLKDKIVTVKRIGDSISSIKLALEKEFVHVISACSPQVGLDKGTKR